LSLPNFPQICLLRLELSAMGPSCFKLR
jgi:hypothetical protein